MLPSFRREEALGGGAVSYERGTPVPQAREKAEKKKKKTDQEEADNQEAVSGPFFKLPPFPKLTNSEPFAAWFVVTGDAIPDGMVGSWSH